MGSAPLKNDAHMWNGQNEVRNIVMGEVQGLGSSDEDELRTNGVAVEIKNSPDKEIQDLNSPPKPQPQGSVVHWDKFLPLRSLKVLLVENDDSTRQVVSALLRNCSYEVTSVATGLQAWRILEDLTNHIDLVLTEVVMPFVSGVGLLCKIMSHKTLKNIPVIMMSSHDSMGLVFKCLSKGAVDFLVKPIRKNELKNLWQHIWRRCHSSSGSGSESGTQSKTCGQSKCHEESGNNAGSSNEHEVGSNGLSIRDGSDNGSGTQSSWTKRAAEVDSSQPISPWDQVTDGPDSTCAQVAVHTKTETFSSKWMHVTETNDCPEQDKQVDNIAMGKDLKMGIYSGQDSELNCFPSENQRQNKLSELDIELLYKKEQMEIKSANVITTVSSCNDGRVESRALDASNGLAGTSQKKGEPCREFREFPALELTLKRPRGGSGDVASNEPVDRNTLRRSDLSAFSKYNTAFPGYQAPMGVTAGVLGSLVQNSALEQNSAMKTETMHNSKCAPPNQQSNESSDYNNDMASTTKYVSKPGPPNDKSESISAFKSSRSSAFQPMQNGHACAEQLMPEKEVDAVVSKDQVQAQDSNKPVQVQHHHHHYHHYHHHHVHNMQHEQQLDHEDHSLKKMAATADQCGSSNMIGGINGQISGNGADEDRFAHREAALIKFREKRKERCFEKKVRYHSRKRLAEQRPRVRGQFVRQIVSNNKAGKGDDSSSDSEQ